MLIDSRYINKGKVMKPKFSIGNLVECRGDMELGIILEVSACNIQSVYYNVYWFDEQRMFVMSEESLMVIS